MILSNSIQSARTHPRSLIYFQSTWNWWALSSSRVALSVSHAHVILLGMERKPRSGCDANCFSNEGNPQPWFDAIVPSNFCPDAVQSRYTHTQRTNNNRALLSSRSQFFQTKELQFSNTVGPNKYGLSTSENRSGQRCCIPRFEVIFSSFFSFLSSSVSGHFEWLPFVIMSSSLLIKLFFSSERPSW